MERDEVLNLLSEHREEIKELGVEGLALFGSVIRGEAGPESDVDVLVKFDGPATFDGYMDLKFFLEEVLGRRVDLVTRKSVKSRLLPYIERDAYYVA